MSEEITRGYSVDRVDGDQHVVRHQIIGGNETVRGNLKVEGMIKGKVKNPYKGLFATLEDLRDTYPPEKTEKGSYAVVGNTIPGPLYVIKGSQWIATGKNGGDGNVVELNDYYTKEEVDSEFTALHEKIIGDKSFVSNGFDYSFVQLGTFATYSELKNTLDTLHSTNNSAQVIGNFRATLNGNLLFITNYVRSWSIEEFIQYIEGTVKLSDDGSLAVTTDVGRFMRKYTDGAWTSWKTADRYDEISDVDETYNLSVISDGSVTLGKYAVNKTSFYVKVEADETAFSAGTIPSRLYNGETFTTFNIPLNQFYLIESSNPITEIALFYLPATITKATSIRVIIYKTNDLAETLNEMGMAITAIVSKNTEQDAKITGLEQADKDIEKSLTSAVTALQEAIVALEGSSKVLSQEEYDALEEKKENVLYFILEE